jgi:hypothetical protein
LKKPFTKIGLVEWLKVKTLSSSPSTTKKKKKSARNRKSGKYFSGSGMLAEREHIDTKSGHEDAED